MYDLQLIYRDAFLVTIADGATSFYAGFAIFAFAGFMAEQLDEPVSEILGSGQSAFLFNPPNEPVLIIHACFYGVLAVGSTITLAFVVYPDGLLRIPGATLWSIFFFLMIFTLGIDSMVRTSALQCAQSCSESLSYYFSSVLWRL